MVKKAEAIPKKAHVSKEKKKTDKKSKTVPTEKPIKKVVAVPR